MADVAQVSLTFTTKQGITDHVPDMLRPADMAIGALQQLLFRKLSKRSPTMQMLYVFVMQGSEGFIPTPDQTIGNLAALFAREDATTPGKQVLSLCLSTSIFQG